jgi:hypothetical protein
MFLVTIEVASDAQPTHPKRLVADNALLAQTFGVGPAPMHACLTPPETLLHFGDRAVLGPASDTRQVLKQLIDVPAFRR